MLTPETSTGSPWPADKPIPQDFLDTYETTDDPMDGIAKLSSDWILKKHA